MSNNIIKHAEVAIYTATCLPDTLLSIGWSDSLGLDTLHCVSSMLYNFVEDFKTISLGGTTRNNLRCVYVGDTGIPTTQALKRYITKTTQTLQHIIAETLSSTCT